MQVTKPKVLLVDSEQATRASLAGRLRMNGCDVVEAEDREGLERAFQNQDVDVVLMEMRSLKSEALMLLTLARRLGREPQVILLTGRDLIALSIKGMQLGAFDDLMAPFDVAVLLGRIRAAWARRLQVLGRPRSVLPRAIRDFAAGVGLSGVRLWYGEVPSNNNLIYAT